MARLTKYDDKRTPYLSKMLARKGLVDREIAEVMEINISTLNRWKTLHPKFKDSLKEGKEASDAEVEDSLYKKAIGYEVTKKIIEKDAEGKIIKKRIERWKVAPDITAMIFWLKNRQPGKWRDQKQVEAVVQFKKVQELSDDELDNEIKRLNKEIIPSRLEVMDSEEKKEITS